MLLPPLGLLAAWRYYNAGHVDLNVAMLLAARFLLWGSNRRVWRDCDAPGRVAEGVRRAVDFAAHDLREALIGPDSLDIHDDGHADIRRIRGPRRRDPLDLEVVPLAHRNR